MTLILDIEREDIVLKILPFRGAFDERIGMLQDMGDTVVEVSYAVRISVPTRDVVVTSFAERTVESRQIVLADVRVIAPTA